MKRRLFIAVLLPDNIIKEIKYAIDRIDESVFSYGRPTPEENWHITVKFLGELDEEKIPQIISAMKKTSERYGNQKISIGLKHIDFNSPEKQMMWVHGDKASSETLGEMRESISKNLFELGIKVKDDFEKFTTHITLARFLRRPHKDIAVHEELGISFFVSEIHLMESIFKESGVEYKPLLNIAF